LGERIMGIMFKKNEKLQLEEGYKTYGSTTMKKIRQIMAKCELEGEKSDACKKLFREELGIDIIE
jgi:hypothetical protein